MAKTHRGSGLRDRLKSGRGLCPLCKRTGIKIVYEQEIGEQKFSICKQCRAAYKKGKISSDILSTPA